MNHGFDELAMRAGSMSSRRHVLGLFGRAAAAGVVGGTVLRAWSPLVALAEECQIEYPVADLDDCPNRRQRPGTLDTRRTCPTVAGNDAYGWASYSNACRNYNICYTTCNSSRGSCDQRFSDEAIDACIGAYPTRIAHQLACITHANFTAYGMASGSYFERMQKIYCECCRPPTKVKCRCTGACYTSVQQCLDDCQVGLGCFTDVCLPAAEGECS